MEAWHQTCIKLLVFVPQQKQNNTYLETACKLEERKYWKLLPSGWKVDYD